MSREGVIIAQPPTTTQRTYRPEATAQRHTIAAIGPSISPHLQPPPLDDIKGVGILHVLDEAGISSTRKVAVDIGHTQRAR